MTRGWSAEGLRAVGDDDTLWTAADAAVLLGPPDLKVTEVRRLIRENGIMPFGRRSTNPRSGRYARVYRAEDLIKAYDRLYKDFGKGEL